MKNMQRLKITFCALLAAAFVTGCSSPMEDLTNAPLYSKYINRQYSMSKDCYVFYYLDEPKIIYIGLGIILPKEADSKDIGRSQNGVKIIGIFPKGSVFQIVSLYRETTIEDSYYHYKITPIGSLCEKWPLLDASLITKEIVTPPIIDSRFAKPIE